MATNRKEELKKHVQLAASIGFGLAHAAGEQVGRMLAGLEQDGYINRTEGRRMAKELLGDINQFQKKLSSKVDKKVRRVVQSSGTSSKAKKSKTRAKKRR